METPTEVADNFLSPASRQRLVWYVWLGLALGLTAFAAGLYLFYSLAEPLPGRQAVYFNPSLKIMLAYPAAWLPNQELLDTDGLPRRFAGGTGWFEVSATSGEGVILTEVAASLSSTAELPLGQKPKITTAQIAGQPGAVIMPSEPEVRQVAAVIAYPRLIELGLTSYRFLIIRLDTGNMNSLLNSLKFVSNTTGEVAGLPNIMVYSPPVGASISSPFNVSGIARVFENNVSLKVVNQQNQTIWTGFVTANAPDVGTYGGFSTTIDLSGAEVGAGEPVSLAVYQNSAKDGSEIDKVMMPLKVEAIAPTMVVAAYFGQVGESEEDCLSVFPVERHVPETSAVAGAALNELLKGPTLREREEGYFTSLPPGVTVNRLVIESGQGQVDFSENLDQGVAGSCRVLAIRSQIEKTLRQFSSVQTVVISVNGRSEDILQP